MEPEPEAELIRLRLDNYSRGTSRDWNQAWDWVCSSTPPWRQPQMFLNLPESSCTLWFCENLVGQSRLCLLFFCKNLLTGSIHWTFVGTPLGAHVSVSQMQRRLVFTHKASQAQPLKQCLFLGQEKVHGPLTPGFVLVRQHATQSSKLPLS